MEQKRENFRITYSPESHPKFIMERRKYPVIDVSATGLQYKIKPNELFPDVDTIIHGTLVFQDGTEAEITGKVLRQDQKKRRVILTLTKDVPIPIMMEQHRKWIKRFQAS